MKRTTIIVVLGLAAGFANILLATFNVGHWDITMQLLLLGVSLMLFGGLWLWAIARAANGENECNKHAHTHSSTRLG